MRSGQEGIEFTYGPRLFQGGRLYQRKRAGPLVPVEQAWAEQQGLAGIATLRGFGQEVPPPDAPETELEFQRGIVKAALQGAKYEPSEAIITRVMQLVKVPTKAEWTTNSEVKNQFFKGFAELTSTGKLTEKVAGSMGADVDPKQSGLPKALTTIAIGLLVWHLFLSKYLHPRGVR